jgi:hypothetical protein
MRLLMVELGGRKVGETLDGQRKGFGLIRRGLMVSPAVLLRLEQGWSRGEGRQPCDEIEELDTQFPNERGGVRTSISITWRDELQPCARLGPRPWVALMDDRVRVENWTVD